MSLKKNMRNKIIQWMISALMHTLRWQVKGLELLSPSQKACLLIFWHDELALTTYYLHKNKMTPWAVVSQHNDGQIIADILYAWGFQLLRGSTQSKGAISTSKKMLSLLRQAGNMIILTGDGPRGPRHQVKSGSIRIAQQSGADIVLMRASTQRCWRLRSWDRFIIPKPFSKVEIILEKAPDLPSPERSKSNHQTQSSEPLVKIINEALKSMIKKESPNTSIQN